jgi:hypothetical protein
MKNPFICGKVVSSTSVHALYSLTPNEWELVAGKWEWPIGTSLYRTVRYFRDAHGDWYELSFGRVPCMPVPVVDRELIDRIEKARTFA